MSFISNKSQKTPHSVIREMFALQTGLDNVISFALGEPDFTAPQHVIDATVASLQRGETHYTPNAGIPALRQAVSDLYKRRGLDYKPSEVLIGAGAISMLNLACTAMLDIGDEVLVPDPGWANYVGLMMQVGAVPVPIRLKEENGFMYDVADLQAALTPKTKMILLNSPSNPTGGVASADNLRQIADFAKANDLYILTDEIYRELLWDDEPYTSIAGFPGMKERTVVVDGFSKTYAMTGMRLAWAVAPEEVIVVMTKLLRQGIADRQIPHIPLGNSQIVLIHTYGLVGLAAHDPQVHGVQGELRENTGQDGGNTALGVKQARNQARQQAGNKGAQQSQPAVHAASNQHHGYGAAGGNGAVHGQVGYIQHTEGDVHTDGHDAPYKALCRRAGQRIQK